MPEGQGVIYFNGQFARAQPPQDLTRSVEENKELMQDSKRAISGYCERVP